MAINEENVKQKKEEEKKKRIREDYYEDEEYYTYMKKPKQKSLSGEYDSPFRSCFSKGINTEKSIFDKQAIFHTNTEEK